MSDPDSGGEQFDKGRARRDDVDFFVEIVQGLNVFGNFVARLYLSADAPDARQTLHSCAAVDELVCSKATVSSLQ